MPNNAYSAACRLFLIILAGCVGGFAIAEAPPAKSETKTPAAENPAKSDAKTPVEEKGDIWQEFSFASEEELQLTEKQVQEILEKLKAKSPQQAAQLEELRSKDTEKFIAAIREEIKKHKSAPEAPKKEDWKQELYKKHEAFLAWFKKGYAQDYEDLIGLQVTSPEEYVQRFMDLMKIYEPIQRMERYNPKLAATMKKNLELQKRRDALLLQIRIASKDQQPKLIEGLHAIVSQRFDTIVLEKQLRYEWLKSRLENLAQKVEERAKELEALNKNKDQSVQDRLDELLERTGKVKWD